MTAEYIGRRGSSVMFPGDTELTFSENNLSADTQPGDLLILVVQYSGTSPFYTDSSTPAGWRGIGGATYNSGGIAFRNRLSWRIADGTSLDIPPTIPITGPSPMWGVGAVFTVRTPSRRYVIGEGRGVSGPPSTHYDITTTGEISWGTGDLFMVFSALGNQVGADKGSFSPRSLSSTDGTSDLSGLIALSGNYYFGSRGDYRYLSRLEHCTVRSGSGTSKFRYEFMHSNGPYVGTTSILAIQEGHPSSTDTVSLPASTSIVSQKSFRLGETVGVADGSTLNRPSEPDNDDVALPSESANLRVMNAVNDSDSIGTPSATALSLYIEVTDDDTGAGPVAGYTLTRQNESADDVPVPDARFDLTTTLGVVDQAASTLHEHYTLDRDNEAVDRIDVTESEGIETNLATGDTVSAPGDASVLHTVTDRFISDTAPTPVESSNLDIELAPPEMPKPPTYRFFVDWHKNGHLDITDFESGPEGWTAHGSHPPELESIEADTISGSRVLRINWEVFNPIKFGVAGSGLDEGRFGPDDFINSKSVFRFGDPDYGLDAGRFGFDSQADPTVHQPSLRRKVDGFVVGEMYPVELWHKNVSNSPVMFGAAELSGSDVYSFAVGEWELLTFSFVADRAGYTFRLRPQSELLSAAVSELDYFRIIGSYDEITNRVLDTGVKVRYGRDSSRNLDDVSPGELSLELLNRDYRFTPDNESSPIHGFVDPGRPVMVKAWHGDREYTLFRGFIDQLQLNPVPLGTVDIVADDLLGRLAEKEIETECYPALQSGQAIHKVLDAIDWPKEKRDIDIGASTLRYWCEDGSNALEAIKDITVAEGMPSIYFIDARGWFCFRDRHHRLLRPRSRVAQDTYHDKYVYGAEPKFATFEYDLGFEDVFNKVKLSVKETKALAETVVWEGGEDSWVIPNLGSKEIETDGDSAFIDAVTPVKDTDFKSYGLGTPVVKLDKHSGNRVKITITATGGEVTIRDLKLRAKPIESTEYTHTTEDQASIEHHEKKSYEASLPWVNRNDARSISDIILGHRARRTPTAVFEVNNNHPLRWNSIFERDISDRVHVTEPETFTDHDYYIESIEQTITETGKVHKAVYSAERVSDQYPNVLTFDDPDRGFDDGVFGITGLVPSDSLFIVGSSNLGGSDLLTF